jgi:hypothetical protein
VPTATAIGAGSVETSIFLVTTTRLVSEIRLVTRLSVIFLSKYERALSSALFFTNRPVTFSVVVHPMSVGSRFGRAA